MGTKKKRVSAKSGVDRPTGPYTAKQKAEILKQMDAGL